MGTIYEQPPRRHHDLVDSITEVMEACRVAGEVDAAAVITAAIELHRLKYWVNDRDIHDEQMSGIAHCLDRISDAIISRGQ